jgi:dTDP-4-amino-4,6-dideoxygalactose transaminase
MKSANPTTGKSPTNVPAVDLVAAYTSHAMAIKKSLEKVLQAGVYILGDNVREFEQEFASYSGVRYGVGVASGTDALTLSMMALGISRGDEVITVANTASPTAMAILNSGARPVLVDPSSTSFVMEASKLKRALSKRTRAIIPVHLYGNPCDMKALIDFSSEHDLLVVEDCAQSHGASLMGRSLGSFGIAGCYSFYPTKNLGAFGDGGMIVTDSEALAERLRSLRMYGMRGVYSSLERGLCSRLDEVQAAILRTKLRYLPNENERRKKNAAVYRDLLEEVAGIGLQEETRRGKHVYHQFVVTVDNRDQIRSGLTAEGIGTGVHYPVAICDQPAFKRYASARVSYQISRRLARTVLSIPVHPFLTHDAILYVAARLAHAVEKAG